MGGLAENEARRHNIVGINNPLGNSLSLAAGLRRGSVVSAELENAVHD